MREQSSLPDGAINYGQGVIGPSAWDIALSRNPLNSPLRRFPTNDALRTGALLTTPLVLASCVTVSPPEESFEPETTDGTNLVGVEVQSISQRLDSFLSEHNGQLIDLEDSKPSASLLIKWTEALGIPKEAIVNIYPSPGKKAMEISMGTTFLPEITSDFFEFVGRGEGSLPSKGDIIIGHPDTNGEDRVGIVNSGDWIEDNGDVYGAVFIQDDLGGPSYLDTEFNLGNAIGWLRPIKTRAVSPQNPNDNGDVLIARADSMEDIFRSFFKEHNGQEVEVNDDRPLSLNQCMDLIAAWALELGIPLEAVTGLELAKNLYLNPHKLTRDFFDIEAYEEGMEFELGDIAVWGEEVGTSAGHVAISTGEKGKYFSANYPLEKDPRKRVAHLQTISNKGLIGRLTPIGFRPNRPAEPKPTETTPEFSDDTELAKYLTAKEFFQTLKRPKIVDKNEGGVTTQTTFQQLDLSDERIEEISRALAYGEMVELDEPVAYYSTVYPYNQSFGSQVATVAYLNYFSITPVSDYGTPQGYGNELSPAQKANGLQFAGNLQMTLAVKYGEHDIRGHKIQSGEYDYSQISDFTSWIDAGVGPSNLLVEKTYLPVSVRNGELNVLDCGYGVSIADCGPGYRNIFSLVYIPSDVRAGAGGYERIE